MGILGAAQWQASQLRWAHAHGTAFAGDAIDLATDGLQRPRGSGSVTLTVQARQNHIAGGARCLSAQNVLLTVIALVAGTVPAAAQQVQVYNNAAPEKLSLGKYVVPGGKTLDLAVGIGSSLFHMPGDPADRFWALSDRGPNIACSDAEDILGVDPKVFCSGIKQGRIYPLPGYAPSIFELHLDREKGTFSVVDTITLKRADGTPVTGLPNPLTKATTETPLDGNGKLLATDAAALDTEALVRLPDGTFWIGEENAPSILHVAADGKVLKRFVPHGSEGDFAQSGYPVAGTLPAILTKRQLNRGIESLALDSDGFLWAVLQNPLVNPDADAFKAAANARMLKIDPVSGAAVAEYVYTLEPMKGFPGEEKKAQSTARISELAHIGGTRFLIDDRTDKTTRICSRSTLPAPPTSWGAVGTIPPPPRPGAVGPGCGGRSLRSRSASSSTAPPCRRCPRRSKASLWSKGSSTSSTTTISASRVIGPACWQSAG